MIDLLDEKIKSLVSEQKEKISELKKKTEFDATKRLIEKYEDKPVAQPIPPQNNQNHPRNSGSSQLTHRSNNRGSNKSLPTKPPVPRNINNSTSAPVPIPENRASQPTGVVTIPANKYGTSPKPWLENIIDRHNGLVLEEEVDTIQYVCPKCGAFNPSKASLSSSPVPKSSADSTGLGISKDSVRPPKFPSLENQSNHTRADQSEVSSDIPESSPVSGSVSIATETDDPCPDDSKTVVGKADSEDQEKYLKTTANPNTSNSPTRLKEE
ncbi:hypothetical protein AYI68_g2075 [Smittium mucronatum]|uniref:Endoplasmic reticulum junction formation protein lunapark n=1 Tax=Smittium mucronatum TaxID=133383 RepID=A0A1R0H3S8_9FUNG|nr:hypothetical protein AYI68_g2075 [Smittium mucronatum]